jgi:hypothetical protein
MLPVEPSSTGSLPGDDVGGKDPKDGQTVQTFEDCLRLTKTKTKRFSVLLVTKIGYPLLLPTKLKTRLQIQTRLEVPTGSANPGVGDFGSTMGKV